MFALTNQDTTKGSFTSMQKREQWLHSATYRRLSEMFLHVSTVLLQSEQRHLEVKLGTDH